MTGDRPPRGPWVYGDSGAGLQGREGGPAAEIVPTVSCPKGSRAFT
jgi:hypothetical protein